LTLILFGTFAYFYYKNKQEARERQKELDNQRQLIEATIEATEEERKRISRDLHDGVGQQLSGLKMGWQRLSNKINAGTLTSSEGITDLTKILDDATNDVRTISHQMMPKSLSEFGLVPTFEDMLEKSFAQTGIQYDFDSFGITKRFDEKTEIAVFRIAQELVNNILKHSAATEVEIQLYQTKGNLILSVADNGKGLQADQLKNKGHGMMNMQSRAKAISAEIHFEKNGDGGLVTTLRVPV
jgi:signal transduction histidine kinase